MSTSHLIADRTKQIEVSGIRKVFELGRSLKDPINLSIGQPHFPVPDAIKNAAKDAIDRNLNGYTVTQGVAELRERILADLKLRYGHADRDVIITSGTSGGLLLAMMAVVNPGDEVIIPDPYFVSYPHLVTLVGGKSVYVDTYPDFRIDPDKIEAAITAKTKVILLCSPSNPTGATVSPDVQKALAAIADKHGVLLLSDEIYRAFHYDETPQSPASHSENVLVIEGYGKTYGMTGWRLGYAHGPKAIVDEMMKLQQFTFVCAPSIVQYAGIAAMDFDVTGSRPSLSAQSTENAETPAMHLDDLVFDVTASHKPIPEVAKKTADKAEPADADQGLAFMLDFPGADKFESAPEQAVAKPSMDIGLAGISLNLNEPVAPAPAPAAGGEDEHWHDVATKLDLANAYKEMGDAAGACDILEEVVRDGDGQQRAAAEALLRQLR